MGLPDASQPTGPLSYYAINVNSLAKPFAKEQFSADLMAYNIDIAIISESKLKKHHKDDFLAIPGYKLFRRDLVGRIGGGVVIYSRDFLKSTLCQISNDNRELELLWVRSCTATETVITGALYHQPKPCLQTFSITSRDLWRRSWLVMMEPRLS